MAKLYLYRYIFQPQSACPAGLLLLGYLAVTHPKLPRSHIEALQPVGEKVTYGLLQKMARRKAMETALSPI